MIVNGDLLLKLAPIIGMVPDKTSGPGGTSYGLGEAGYDIRIKQEITFRPDQGIVVIDSNLPTGWRKQLGRFALASAIEEFNMSDSVTGIVHDKSTWARRGLSVFNTVIEPGWKGFLTLELVYHGEGELIIPAGSGIAQVIFHAVSCPMHYKGKYQNQGDKPTPPIEST